MFTVNKEKKYIKIYMEIFELNYATMTDDDFALMKFTIDSALDKDNKTGNVLNENEFKRLCKFTKKHNPMKIINNINKGEDNGGD